MNRYWFFVLGFFLLIACDSESFTNSEIDRAQLLPGFESYASREEVVAKLGGPSTTIVEDSTRSKESQPPYKVYAVKLAYQHLEEPGDLLLTFFNNRLMQTSFYPVNFERYVAALRASGITLQTGSELKKQHTAIWIGTDFDNKPYIGWADDRLRAQQRRWLSRYA